MNHKVRSRVQVNGGFSDEFEVNVGVHQDSKLSPLLFLRRCQWSVDKFCYLGDMISAVGAEKSVIARTCVGTLTCYLSVKGLDVPGMC